MRTRFELADVVRLFYSQLVDRTTLTPLRLKVLSKIADCRTAALGGHEEVCQECGTVRYSYNSCGDRHCPKCQAAKQAFWIEDLVQSTLPVRHYHIVFTVPHQLNGICLHNDRMYYALLFDAVLNTLRSFGYSLSDPRRVPSARSTPGDRTFHCIRTFTVLSLLQDIPSTGSGRLSDIQGSIFIRYIN